MNTKRTEDDLRRKVQRWGRALRGFPNPTATYWLFIGVVVAVTCAAHLTYITYFRNAVLTYIAATVAYSGWTVLAISLGHQAFHGTLMRDPGACHLVGSVLFVPLGVDGELWALRHVRDHHPAPNTKGFDADIDNPLIFRLAPYTERRWYHRFQHLYAPFVYSIGVLYTALVDDLRAVIREASALPRDRRGRLYLRFGYRKVMFGLLWVGLPMIAGAPYSAVEYFQIMLVATMPSAWLFLPIAAAHLNEHTQFYAQQDGKSFSALQGETTIDFANRSRFMTHLYGGLNCHLAHHLWPNVASCHYGAMYDYLESLGAPEPLRPISVSFGELFASHFRFLRRMGNGQVR
jgi:linoleoyl-CoA desaturase